MSNDFASFAGTSAAMSAEPNCKNSTFRSGCFELADFRSRLFALHRLSSA